jgi:hypothetical protein
MGGTRNFSSYANYVYNGTSSQITGNGLPSNVRSLTINNSAGVTVISNVTVSNSLNLTNGNLLTGLNSITLGTSVTNTGSLTTTNGKVLGNLNRWLSNSSPNVFPVGPTALEYTPVTLSNVVGSGIFTVSAVDGIHPNATGTDFLQMYWKLTNGGIISADVTFNYLQSDVVGDETSYDLFRYNGIMIPYSPFSLNAATNVASVSGLNSFSDWTLGIDGNVPVELSSFTANVIGKSVKLNWQTETEVNNYGFEIERSVAKNSWEKIGFVNGSGNSNSQKKYSFTDENVLSEKYSYRLKQVDNDGQFEYSKTIEVSLIKPAQFSLEQNYPNPFNPNTTIKFSIPEASNVKVVVFNLLGEEIKTLLNEQKESGTHSVIFNATNLNSGVYLYKIEAGSFIQTRKMTLVK